MQRMSPGILACAFCLMTWPAAVNRLTAGEQVIQPPDVYSHVGLLAAEIELVRRELGAPRDTRPAIVVQGAQPRENYFQALSLCRKAQRLCFDYTGRDGLSPASNLNANVISPGDVFEVVEAAAANIRRVKVQLGITEKSAAPRRDPSKTPSDVFGALIHAGRQLTLLLDARPSPTAVYEQLTEAVGTASRVLSRIPGATQSKEPAFERGKTPADVHARLVRCYDRVHAATKGLGLSSLEVDWKIAPEQLTPGDVYDMATLLVSELLHLEAMLPRATGPTALIDLSPGRKLPAHNFQRAGLLEAQVNEIGKHLEAHPELLRRATASE